MKNNILIAAGIGVVAALVFLYLTPKIKKEGTVVIQQKQKAMKLAAYPPPLVNFPNNASKPPEKDYLALYGRRYY